jgi:predicted nucleic acid-binding protein
MIKSKIRVVCDAGPIIHLDELDCLGLLTDFQEILISDTIWKEIKRYRPLDLKRSDLSFTLSPVKYPISEILLTICRIFSLDAGETEALAIMENNPNTVFLTDDASARLVAKQMGFKVHGTIGILVRSIRRGQMKPEEVISIIKKIPIKSTLHIKPSLIEEVIFRIKKEFKI